MTLVCRGLNCTVVRAGEQPQQADFIHAYFSLQEDFIMLSADTAGILQPGDRIYPGIEFEATTDYHQVGVIPCGRNMIHCITSWAGSGCTGSAAASPSRNTAGSPSSSP